MFKPVVGTFNSCKPIIQIDGMSLYGKYEGTLLITTSQDGNGCVLSIAFAIVEKETQSDWHTCHPTARYMFDIRSTSRHQISYCNVTKMTTT